MLDHLTTSHSKTDKSQFNKYWRGRYGHTEEEQAKIWASINPDPETVGEGLGTSSTATATVPLRFKTFEGEIRVVDAKIGDTLLQVARQWDLPSMEGSCGGNLGMSLGSTPIPAYRHLLLPALFSSPASLPILLTCQNAQRVTSTSPSRVLYPNQPIPSSTC